MRKTLLIVVAILLLLGGTTYAGSRFTRAKITTGQFANTASTSSGSSSPVVASYLLMTTGDYLLLTTGDKILKAE